jgi:thioredoxin 1
MAASNVLAVTTANADQEVLKSALPVVVDFWAEWCGPCKMIAPMIDQLAGEYAGRVKVAKADMEQDQQWAAAFRIQAIPTILFFKGGRVVDQVVGAKSLREMKAKFDSLLQG